MTKYATLGYLKRDNKYLLGKKKYGGAKGKLNGFGGKVDDTDDSFKSALIREFKEETNLDIKNPRLRGTLVFPNENELHVIYVYNIEEYDGIPEESEEMTVGWYAVDDINLKEMWPNDQVWFNLLNLPFDFVVVFSGSNIDDYNTDIKIRLIKNINENTYKKY